MQVASEVFALIDGRMNATSASSWGSRPSWALVGAERSNQLQVALEQGRTMSECEAHHRVSEEGLRVPDHSVLMWDLWVDDSMANLTEIPNKEDGSDAHKK